MHRATQAQVDVADRARCTVCAQQKKRQAAGASACIPLTRPASSLTCIRSSVWQRAHATFAAVDGAHTQGIEASTQATRVINAARPECVVGTTPVEHTHSGRDGCSPVVQRRRTHGAVPLLANTETEMEAAGQGSKGSEAGGEQRAVAGCRCSSSRSAAVLCQTSGWCPS